MLEAVLPRLDDEISGIAIGDGLLHHAIDVRCELCDGSLHLRTVPRPYHVHNGGRMSLKDCGDVHEHVPLYRRDTRWQSTLVQEQHETEPNVRMNGTNIPRSQYLNLLGSQGSCSGLLGDRTCEVLSLLREGGGNIYIEQQQHLPESWAITIVLRRYIF